ncbi:hypothetical protein DPMN_115277 [Dreissena polymorpha]|uniref:Uncharacterized protein n=1 Tax=Dreissena polymorpha TaxID=45954 RepID=A0A9D4KM54_DREPO|nr:hypothetical protein DPMN_115277 [Dreissena polymorpha]
MHVASKSGANGAISSSGDGVGGGSAFADVVAGLALTVAFIAAQNRPGKGDTEEFAPLAPLAESEVHWEQSLWKERDSIFGYVKSSQLDVAVVCRMWREKVVASGTCGWCWL